MEPDLGTAEALLARDAWIRRLAATLAGPGVSADDLAQETWERALAHRSAAPVRDPRAWLATLLRNVARNRRRDDGRHVAREHRAAAPEQDAARGPFDLAAYEERRGQLVRAVEMLPPAQRAAIVARYWEGLEPAEIARRHGEDAAAVRQRLRRAISSLRKRIGEEAPQGDRRAWLLPLLGDRAPETAATGASVAGVGFLTVLGGLLMKGPIAVLAGVVVVWALVAVGSPDETAVPAAAGRERAGVPEPPAAPGSSFASEEEGRQALAPVVRVPSEVQRDTGATGPAVHTLLDADGAALSGIAYWLDERPHDRHRARAPVAARRTDAHGSFALRIPPSSGAAFLWFEIDDGLSIAVQRSSLAEREVVQLPRRKVVTVEIRSLPAGEPWTIRVCPAWRDDDGHPGLIHGSQRAERLDVAVGGEVWVVRRSTTRSSPRGPATVRVPVVAGRPAAFYCTSRRYRIEPEIQEIHDPEHVVSHAAEARAVTLFEIVEADGTTPSAVGGRVMLASPSVTWVSHREFAGGRGEVAWDAAVWLADARLVFVLRTGEVFERAMSDPRIGDRQTLRLVRGTGRGAALSLRRDATVAAWPGCPEILFESGGRFRRAGLFGHLSPPAPDEAPGAAAWLHEGRVVVQVDDPSLELGRVLAVSRDGRLARAEDGRLIALPVRAMEPVDPKALIEKLALPAGAARLMVAHEVAWPSAATGAAGPVWIRARTLRFHRVPEFGWRYSRTASADAHEPLPASVPIVAPRGASSRLRALVRGTEGWIDLPHAPLN